MADYIYFKSRDELLRFDTSSIVYFEAMGNFTKIILANGFEGQVCMNLAKMQERLTLRLEEKAKRFVRVGKSHIINVNYLLQVIPLRQKLILSDQKSFSYELSISKEALRAFMNIIIESKSSK